MRMENLNEAFIKNAGPESYPLRHAHSHKVSNADGSIVAMFDHLPTQLSQEIRQWPVVVGCVAWLTNEEILTALQSREHVSLLVNKEDFLRPDSAGSYREANLRRLYASLPGTNRYIHNNAGFYNVCSDPTVEGVRCVGVSGRRSDVPPRMHHKFLVFCNKVDRLGPLDEVRVFPRAVWTGSFNFTENGRRSLENAVLIRDAGIASAYYAEWEALLGISERLNWSSEYVDPEYRFGT